MSVGDVRLAEVDLVVLGAVTLGDRARVRQLVDELPKPTENVFTGSSPLLLISATSVLESSPPLRERADRNIADICRRPLRKATHFVGRRRAATIGACELRRPVARRRRTRPRATSGEWAGGSVSTLR